MSVATILTTQSSEVTSRYFGYAPSIQQGKSTAGQRVQLTVLAAIMLAAQSVLVRWHADATSCKHVFLA